MTTKQTQTHLFGGPWTAVLLLAPGLLLFTAFVAYPAVQALTVSTQSWTGFSPEPIFVGTDNYDALLHTDRFWSAVRNTLYFTAVGGVIHFGLAFLFSAALHHPSFAAKKFFQTIIVFPSFVSVVAVATLWAGLYNAEEGLINAMLAMVDIEGIRWLAQEHAREAFLAPIVWSGLGSHVLLLLAGMRRIPASYMNAARLDGATELQVFWHVTLPMLKGVTYTALALWIIGGMQIFGVVQTMLGPEVPEYAETMTTYQYAISFNAKDNIYLMGRGSAIAVFLVAMILLAVGALRLLFGKRELEF